MGLDCIATKDGKPVHDDDLEARQVIRGLFTLATEEGQKASGIRGKAYEQFVARDDDLTLYENLTALECQSVAARLEEAARATAVIVDGDGDSFTANELTEAARWFAICAYKGYGTIAWALMTRAELRALLVEARDRLMVDEGDARYVRANVDLALRIEAALERDLGNLVIPEDS